MLFPLLYESKNISTAAVIPPIKAKSGRAIAEDTLSTLKITINNNTNNPEPELIPKVPGLAISLRSKLCITHPAVPIPIPTRIVNTIRGRRKSYTIRFCLAVPFPRRTLKTSEGDRFILPEFTLITATNNSTMVSTKIIVKPRETE